MKFVTLKKEKNCPYCGVTILSGEPAVSIFAKKGYVVFYHTECYIPALTNWYTEALSKWTREQRIKRPAGRPKVHTNGKEVNKLRALIRYHRKLGHDDKVTELERRLNESSNMPSM